METLKQGEIKVVQDSQTSVTTVSASQTTATAVRGLETKMFMRGLVSTMCCQMFL